MKRLPKKELGLLVLGLGLLGYALIYFYQRHETLKPVSLPQSGTVITTSTTHPSEAPINTTTTIYHVAPDMPKLISLPSIGAKGFIEQVGDTKTNAMATPNSVGIAGWYVHSVKPGATGLSIINGHVQGHYEPGIFKRLSNLKAGDTFYVAYGDASQRTFQVVSDHTYPVAEVTQHLYVHDATIRAQLDLITCGGQYDKASREYSQRVLIIATAI